MIALIVAVAFVAVSVAFAVKQRHDAYKARREFNRLLIERTKYNDAEYQRWLDHREGD